MKAWICLITGLTATAAGQIATPTTPTKFGTRDIQGGSTASVAMTGKPEPSEATARLVSHYSFGEARQWRSADGRSLVGKMIAFEDAVVEKTAANAAAAKAAALAAPAPAPPARFTLMRDGKIRLLVNNKPYEVALERLSEEDRAFARQVEAVVNPK